MAFHRNLKISLITVSRMASCNLQKFGPFVSRLREIRLFLRNQTDFVKVNNPVYIA